MFCISNPTNGGKDFLQQSCSLEKLQRSTITLKKKKKRKETTATTVNQRIGKKGKREGSSPSNVLLGRGIGERGRFSLSSHFAFVTLWLGLKSFNKHWQPSLLVNSLKFSCFKRICENKGNTF